MKLTSVVLFALAVAPTYSQAALVHQYTFNDGMARDSVGGADGVPVGAATVSGGRLHLDGGQSTEPAEVAYVNLPNGIIADLMPGVGRFGLTFEAWVSAEVHRPWASVYGFAAATNLPDGGDFINYSDGWALQLAVDPIQHLRSSTYCTCVVPGPGGDATLDLSFPIKEQKHIAVTLDVEPQLYQPFRPGSIVHSLYVDGQLADTVTPSSAFHSLMSNPYLLSTLNNTNNWIGRAPWSADPYFNGSLDEFRIYSTALSAEEVMASYLAGPTPVPEPQTVMLAVSMLCMTGAVIVRCPRHVK